MSDTEGVLILVAIALFYFLPAIVAAIRHNPQANAICVLNLLFGWTGIGWGIALIWAVMNPTPKES